MSLDAIMPLVACLPFAWLLIQAAPKLDGDATREINWIEEHAAEAAWWLSQMKGTRQ